MIDWREVIIRLVLAALFGSIIGIERERKDWAAGLRTHMMVSVGSSLIMLVSAYGFSDILGTKNVVLDPSRVAAQVVSGIGFIGAGTILFLKQGAVRGLTTASGLWTVAAIGLATGGGMYFAASVTTAIALIILWGLKPIEKKFFDRFKETSIKIITNNSAKSIEVVNKVFQNALLEISDFSLSKMEEGFNISYKVRGLNSLELTSIINELQLDPNIKEVGWSN
jgi:putative Mg2+ transporter-C (MgtC) family protein